jgi:DedD protein
VSDSQEKSAPEFNPKHRIVGAVVLVALAVIFFPMLLENREAADNHGTSVIEIPQKEKKIFVSKITPVDGEPDTAPTASAPDTVSKSESAPATPAAKPKPKVEKPAASSKAPAAAKPTIEHAAKAETGWAVRIGTFAQHKNADRIVSVLKKKGFDPHTQKIKTAGNKATRVWLGPFAKKDQAQKVRARILEQTGQEGLIVSYP